MGIADAELGTASEHGENLIPDRLLPSPYSGRYFDRTQEVGILLTPRGGNASVN